MPTHHLTPPPAELLLPQPPKAPSFKQLAVSLTVTSTLAAEKRMSSGGGDDANVDAIEDGSKYFFCGWHINRQTLKYRTEYHYLLPAWQRERERAGVLRRKHSPEHIYKEVEHQRPNVCPHLMNLHKLVFQQNI